MSLNEILTSNGEKIKPGDSIELSDLVGNKYKQTKNYDINIENPIKIYEYDSYDFKFVEIIPTKDTDLTKIKEPFIVHKLLSKFQDEVTAVEIINTVKYVYTTNFKIDIENALKYNEITLLKDFQDLRSQSREEMLIESIREVYEIYSMGLFNHEEYKYQMKSYMRFYFDVQERWETEYAQSISGQYYKRKNK